MPLTLKLDENDDLDVSGGTLHVIEGPDAIAQDLRTAFRTVLGEWFMGRQTVGTDWLGEVFRHAPNLAAITALLREKALSREGVLGVTTLELDTRFISVDRTLHVSFEVETVEGRVAASAALGL